MLEKDDEYMGSLEEKLDYEAREEDHFREQERMEDWGERYDTSY